jgi:outer membrane biogenesis lipoprotein LolB
MLRRSTDLSKLTTRRGRTGAGLVSALLVAAALAAGCGPKDPEENFQLWSNNQDGWQQLGTYAGDPKNPIELRARAL